MRRRPFLEGLAGSAAFVVAGCLETPVSDVSSSETAELNEISVVNRREEPVSIDLEVDWDGETVLEETYELSGAETNDTDQLDSANADESVWPSDTGDWTVSARVDDGDWATVTPNDVAVDCVELMGIVGEDEPEELVWRYNLEGTC